MKIGRHKIGIAGVAGGAVLGLLLLVLQGQQKASLGATVQYSPDTIWVDVRTPQEFQNGHLPNAVNLPLQTIAQDIAQRFPDTTSVLALYCRSGNRSGIALQILQEKGYINAFNAGAYQQLRQRF
jgi:phage shock protein E